MEIDHFGNNEKIDDFIRRRELTKYVDAAGVVEPYDSMHTIDSMYEESMAKTKSVREDPEIRQKMKKFASDGAKPKDFSSLNADQRVIAKRMKARYELLNSGTPEASSRNQKSEMTKEVRRIGEKYNIKVDIENSDIPDSLHISSFATQESSFLNMQKFGSIRRVLNATKKPIPVKADMQEKLDKLLMTKSTKQNDRLLQSFVQERQQKMEKVDRQN